MEHLRLLLIVALTFTGFQLWEAWQKDYGPTPIAATPATTDAPSATSTTPTPVAVPAELRADATNTPVASNPVDAPTARIVTAKTDLFELKISTAGGTLQSVSLLAYPTSSSAGAPPVELLGTDASRVFIEESGLTGSDSRRVFLRIAFCAGTALKRKSWNFRSERKGLPMI